jgi:hypothetical protein
MKWRLNSDLNLLEKINFDDCNSFENLQSKMKLILGKSGKLSEILKNFTYLCPDEKQKMGLKINYIKEILELKYKKRLEELK